MAQVTDIFNVACGILGVPRVTSATDTTGPAVTLNQFWPALRDKVIADHRWNGVTKIATLDQIAAAPEANWDYQYTLPSDCLRVVTLNGEKNDPGSDRWAIATKANNQGRVLLTDESSAVIEYTADVGDAHAGNFEPGLVMTLGYELAVLAANSFGLSVSDIQVIRDERDTVKSDAKAVDGQEGSPLFFTDMTLADAHDGRY